MVSCVLCPLILPTPPNMSYPSILPREHYQFLLDFAFRRVVNPKSFTMAYEVYKCLYRSEPERFAVVCEMHQNHAHDRLHFSVRVNLGTWFHTLHFNGYFKTKFILTDITAQTRNGSVVTTETILEIESDLDDHSGAE